MAKGNKKVKDNSIAGRIKSAMVKSSTICLAVLGIVSLICIIVVSKIIIKNDMTEIAEISAQLVAEEIQGMKDITYEIGCNPILASTEATNEEKIAILQSKVTQYGYTGCGLTMQDNIDIVSGWDCTTQDTVVQALAGNVYFSEPKIKEGGPLTSYFSAPLWKDGIANGQIIGTVIFMSNDYFLQDMVTKISLSESCQTILLDQHGNTIADSTQETLSEIVNVIELAKEDSSYSELAKQYSKMVAQETGFDSYSHAGSSRYIAYAPVAGAYVSAERSRMGAYQNALEHTINNLDNTVENTTAAESRIRDVDMAEMMVKYSKENILEQAGQSMMAQANNSTEGVLSLLQ